jgi:nucleotide-binding universal stress UspA family protein
VHQQGTWAKRTLSFRGESMIHLQRILFPIAFSNAADCMASSVREMAERFNATITILNAFNPLPEYFQGPLIDDCCSSREQPALPYSAALLDLRDLQKERLETFAESHFSRMHYTVRIEDGDPAMVIEWVANCEKTDVILMPTRGLGRFRRRLLGSVTSKVLHDTSIPLWTSTHKPELSASLPQGCRSILCAVGMNQRDDDVFKTAQLFAGAYDASICLLHIQVPADTHDRQFLAQSIRRSFYRVCADCQATMNVRVRVLDEELPEGICQAAHEEGADLVIVGRGHVQESFAQMWSHLYTIIRESPCPVLSV